MHQFSITKGDTINCYICIYSCKKKLVVTFWRRVLITNAHFNLKRKAAYHQFSLPFYVKTQERHC